MGKKLFMIASAVVISISTAFVKQHSVVDILAAVPLGLLAEYLVKHASGESLEDYLDQKVFAGMTRKTASPDPQDEAGFDAYMERFVACIPAQQAAVRALKA